MKEYSVVILIIAIITISFTEINYKLTTKLNALQSENDSLQTELMSKNIEVGRWEFIYDNLDSNGQKMIDSVSSE